MDEGAWLVIVHGVAKSRTRLSNFTSLYNQGFPGGTSGKQPACQCRRCKRLRFNLWVGRSPGGGHGNPLQCSCLKNSLNREDWRATVHRFVEGWTRLKQLSVHPRMLYNHDCSGKCPEKRMREQACSKLLKCLTQPTHYYPKRTKRLTIKLRKIFLCSPLFFFQSLKRINQTRNQPLAIYFLNCFLCTCGLWSILRFPANGL